MVLRKFAASAALVALVAANPAVAQAASSAQSLSVAKSVPQSARVGASLRGANKQSEVSPALYVAGAVVVGLAIYGLYELVDSNGSGDSDSP